MSQDVSSSAAYLGGEDGSGQVVEHNVDPDRLADLRAILTEPKARLLQQILASQTGALSAVELAARNEITESTIRDHLRNLQNRDPKIVTVLEADASPVPNGIPRKYYAVTEYGIGLLKQVNLYDQIGILYDMYEAAELELPDIGKRPVTIEEIEWYEHRPSPDWL
ncbi:hypothetical protein G6M89_14830 [Natronolimnobius sp. AArcel1]|uniref:hypothetical protein n=1 Tax=Natronolimnobius sp. AArcel1 TaxID=1679093 RepID=UPI0013EBB8BA|nr:hypothetical protein [Natronolimnobius sp. AArcel1]NGM70269.1 hypothetical protein [Natronolimnobius sp. AArcel1]